MQLALLVLLIAACQHRSFSEADSLSLSVKLLEGGFFKQDGITTVKSPNTLQLDDYFVWGGSVIKGRDEKYHMLFSLWECGEKWAAFQDGWLLHSKIAYAVSDYPDKGFEFQKIVLRGKMFEGNSTAWDAQSVHNPHIKEFNHKYYLYYTGTCDPGPQPKGSPGENLSKRNRLQQNQKIGVIAFESFQDLLTGNFDHPDEPLLNPRTRVKENNVLNPSPYRTHAKPDNLIVVNPSVVYRPSDGKYLLYFKGNLWDPNWRGIHGVAIGNSPTGPFSALDDFVFDIRTEDRKIASAEDPYVWFDKKSNKFYAVIKDCTGKITGSKPGLAVLVSSEGINWQKPAHSLFMKKELLFPDGQRLDVSNLERPQLLIIGDGLPSVLYCACSVEPVRDKKDGSTFNVQISLNKAAGHGLRFSTLAQTWDEAIPLGNGELGALIWQKCGDLRFSLDRSDLWDLRPIESFDKPEFNYRWVTKQVLKEDYTPVQQLFDVPYNQLPGPSKIPGAALEFDIGRLGAVNNVQLKIDEAVCTVEWDSGATLETFVQADSPIGWFLFKNVPEGFGAHLIPPEYQKEGISELENALTGQDLQRLGYTQGGTIKDGNKVHYRQQGWGGFAYEVAVAWKNAGKDVIEGCWSISSTFSEEKTGKRAGQVVDEILKKGFRNSMESHKKWWDNFWAKSSVSLPDSVLENQWYMEQYKFGSAARADTPPISLQAVWTTDHGKLPPWKGDFHHDLNTQLSYWPAYTGNHLDLEEGFLNWLWKNRETFKRYTRIYFGTDGLNVPGVTTLSGEPMGGWIQYSFGPTVSAWLGQHFYLHWIYSKDRRFLQDRAYPWIKDVAVYLDEISMKREDGMRRLPISSSPEINDNRIDAWFTETTNFDLALIRFTFEKAAELAKEMGKKEEAEKWSRILDEWPRLALAGENNGLAFAPHYPYKVSHRHFSHLLGWHPLGIIDWSDGENDQNIIEATLKDLERFGSDYWVGYSFSWLGNLYARAFKGEKAAETLRVFAENFCLPNSFHVNGEQHDRGYSRFKYRPFTLEGNFAFAAGIQEMLLQSHSGVVRIFPAIPSSWQEVHFYGLRAVGAFVIDAEKRAGKTVNVKILAEEGGTIQLQNPFDREEFTITGGNVIDKGEILKIEISPGKQVELRANE